MIAYLSTQTNRVYKSYEEARADAVTSLAINVNETNWDIAKQIANLKIRNNPSKYIAMVELYI